VNNALILIEFSKTESFTIQPRSLGINHRVTVTRVEAIMTVYKGKALTVNTAKSQLWFYESVILFCRIKSIEGSRIVSKIAFEIPYLTMAFYSPFWPDFL
jgi:hypothetical protein